MPLPQRGKYCSNCLSTQRFIKAGNQMVCERCTKIMHIVQPPVTQPGEPIAGLQITPPRDPPDSHGSGEI